MRIYDQVKKLAKEKGVTIQQMEIDLGLSAGNTCKWNDHAPRVVTLRRVADYFEVEIEDLLKDDPRR